MRAMWGKKLSLVAKALLEEGFEVECGDQPVTKPAKEAWEAKRVATMCRNVSNDRAWWEAEWRAKAKVPRTVEDDALARESYVAALESDLEDIDGLQQETGTKSTAKAILQGEKRQTRALIAKARGVDTMPEVEPFDPEIAAKRATIVVYDLSNCSDEVKERYGQRPSG